MFFTGRRIGNNIIGLVAICYFINPFFHRGLDDGGHWLNAFDINFVQLLNKPENDIQFTLHAGCFFIAYRDARKLCHALDRICIY